MTFVLPFPVIDPVLISFGPFVIRWYALAYIFGLLLGWRLMRRLVARSPVVADDAAVDDFLIWATLGVVGNSDHQHVGRVGMVGRVGVVDKDRAPVTGTIGPSGLCLLEKAQQPTGKQKKRKNEMNELNEMNE